MKWASVNRTLFNPFSFFKQIERSSLDSGCASVHACGGDRKRSQLRQKDTEARTALKCGFLRYATVVHTLFWDSFRDIDPIVQGLVRARQIILDTPTYFSSMQHTSLQYSVRWEYLTTKSQPKSELTKIRSYRNQRRELGGQQVLE